MYRTEGVAAPVFRQVSELGAKDLQGLVEQIALRIGRTLEQRVLIERDIENAWLAALVPPPRMHLTRYQGVYGIEIDTCACCGGTLGFIVSIEEPPGQASLLWTR